MEHKCRCARSSQMILHINKLLIFHPVLSCRCWLQLDMENTALTNATRSTLSTASDSQLSADSELDVSMIIEKMQHLKSRLKSASDKLEKPVNMCGNMFCLDYRRCCIVSSVLVYYTLWKTSRLLLWCSFAKTVKLENMQESFAFIVTRLDCLIQVKVTCTVLGSIDKMRQLG